MTTTRLRMGGWTAAAGVAAVVGFLVMRAPSTDCIALSRADLLNRAEAIKRAEAKPAPDDVLARHAHASSPDEVANAPVAQVIFWDKTNAERGTYLYTVVFRINDTPDGLIGVNVTADCGYAIDYPDKLLNPI